MKDFTYSENKQDLQAILKIIEAYGVVRIPDFLNREELAPLRKEFDQLCESPDDKSKMKTPYSHGTCVRITRKDLEASAYPATSSIFSSPFMEDLKNLYLSPESTLNEEIFVVKDVVGSQHVANDMHFDVTPTFKYFIYLEDTTEGNGAFTCIPKSHLETRKLRAQQTITQKNVELTRALPNTGEKPVAVEGNAGTLIIFTTETFHKAGIVSEGERIVMRGHCRLPEYTRKRGLINRILGKR